MFEDQLQKLLKLNHCVECSQESLLLTYLLTNLVSQIIRSKSAFFQMCIPFVQEVCKALYYVYTHSKHTAKYKIFVCVAPFFDVFKKYVIQGNTVKAQRRYNIVKCATLDFQLTPRGHLKTANSNFCLPTDQGFYRVD